MDLNSCVAIAAKMIDLDRDELLSRVDGLVASGIPPKDAQVMAASDILAEIERDRADMEALAREQHPDLFRSPEPVVRRVEQSEPAAPWYFDDIAEDDQLYSARAHMASVLAARNKTLRRVNPASVLDADIARAAKAIEYVKGEIEAGRYDQTEVPIGPMPHVLHMLGAPMQMLQVNASIIRKMLVDKHSEDFSDVTPREFVGALYKPMMVLKGREAGEYDIVTGLQSMPGRVIVATVKTNTELPTLRGGSPAGKAASIKTAYARKVSGGGDTLSGRVLSGGVVYVNEAQAVAALNTHWAQFQRTLAAGLGSRRIKDRADLVKFIEANYKPESSPLGADDMPAYSARVSTGRIRMTVADMVDTAKTFEQWKDWYERHEEVLTKFFGSDADLFGRLLAATSQAADVRSNVALALKAYWQYYANEPFEGYMPSVIKNLERIRAGEDIKGPKIVGYVKANEGDPNGIAVDRHIARVMFNIDKPNARQITAAQRRIVTVASLLKWEPRQVQSSLWAFSQLRAGAKEIDTYDTLIQKRAEQVRQLVEQAADARRRAGGYRAFAEAARRRAGISGLPRGAGEGDAGVAEERSAEELIESRRQGQYDLREFTKGSELIEAVQDRYNRWKQAVEDIREQGGQVSEDNDFYHAEERYWGRVGAQIEDFKAETEKWVREVVRDGLDLGSVALYAYAQHAPDRNAWIAQMRATMPDGGSGMTNAEAQQIIDEARNSGLEPLLQKRADQLRKWVQETRDIMLADGLITPDEYASWTHNMASYVPLRGLAPDSDAPPGKRPGLGQGFNIRGGESKRAMGRRTEARQIIENILADRAKTYIRAGKNEVLRHFLKFVLDNPSPNLWEVNAVESKPISTVDANGDRVIKEGNTVVSDDRTVTVKDGGEEIHIVVRDERLREQLQNLHVENIGKGIGALLFVSRILSRLYTSLSPVFTLVNYARDVQTATVGIIDEMGFAGAAKLWAQMPSSLRDAFKAELAGNRSADYELFRGTGGKTGFFDFKTVDDLSRELQAMAEQADRSNLDPRKMAPKVLDLIERLNAGFENATRFAAFKAARADGKSVAEAARISKNLTVNFNRKGAKTPILSAWFLFFNPAVQGTARMLEALKNPKVLSVIGGAMAGMFLLAMRNGAMGDDDDKIPWWDKIPNEVKERNIVIVLPPGASSGEEVPGSKVGRYIKIPMPYGYNFFASLANQVADLYRNSQNASHGIDKGEALRRAVGAFFGSWVPIPEASGALPGADGKQLVLAAVPDAFNPLAQNRMNINPFGRPLFPESQTTEGLPNASKMFGAQRGTMFEKAASGLNRASGGTNIKPGFVDLAPAQIENLVRGYLGGPATFSMDIANAFYARQSLERPEPDPTKLPFAKQVYGKIDDETDRMLAYSRMDEAQRLVNQQRAGRKLGDEEALDKLSEEAGPLASLGVVLSSARQRMAKFRQHEMSILADDALDGGQKFVEIQKLNAERRRVLQSFNEAYSGALIELRREQEARTSRR